MTARATRFFFASLVILGAPALARADDAQDIAAARTFGTEGVILADAGKCAEAIPKLERAEKLHHAPTTAERLGECLVDTGKVLAGTELLKKLLREPLPNKAPPPFVAAVSRAQKVLDRAMPRIATMHIAVVAPAGTKASVTLDGEPVSDALVDADFPADPGTHAVKATAPGFVTATASVKLGDGEKARVELKLVADPNAKVVVAPPPPPTNPVTKEEPPQTDGMSPLRITSFALVGVGVIGVGVGAVTGIIAAGRKSDLDASCPNKTCVQGSTAEDDLSGAKTLGNVSTISFIAGGVLLAAGGALFFLSAPSRTGITPAIGPGYAGLRGSFE
jgi:hypothetical protein